VVSKRSIAVTMMMAAACGGGSSPAPGAEVLTGSERLGWDEPASDAGDLASFRYAWYVDGARVEATEVSCTPGAAAARFSCTSAVPPMTSGTHSLQVAAFVVDAGATLESNRSTTVRVVKQ
jgi:hypothetical protein